MSSPATVIGHFLNWHSVAADLPTQKVKDPECYRCSGWSATVQRVIWERIARHCF